MLVAHGPSALRSYVGAHLDFPRAVGFRTEIELMSNNSWTSAAESSDVMVNRWCQVYIDARTNSILVAAALDPVGGLLGTREFPATSAGYAGPLGWLGKFGDVALVGVEGTGSYGAGLARYLAKRGVRVVEVDRADRQDRHRSGRHERTQAAVGDPAWPHLGASEPSLAFLQSTN